GLGTRLGSLGRTVPKALIDVGGKSLLERHLEYLHLQGVTRVVINTHHRSEQIRRFAERYAGPLEIVIIEEDKLLGTAGGVRNALAHLEPGPFMVLYGDVLVDEPLDAMRELHRESGAVATLAVHEADCAEGKGVVEVDERGRVTRFAEKETSAKGPALINSGLYVLDSELIAPLRPSIVSDFGRDVLPGAVDRGLPVFAFRLAAAVIDIGTPEGLSQARAAAPAADAATTVEP
ncbi:MAG: nucleotidyltransferase family protein, partial [Actinomycetota bacterium]|nr:nucleotidyltransferase family protein [Actinomycetota bacterium]